MSEKEIKKEIRKLKLEKWCITRLFAEVGSLIGAGFVLLASPGCNIFQLIALIIVILIWDGMMISMAYAVKGTPELIKEIDEDIEKLKNEKEVTKTIEKNFSERLKKGEYKILLKEDEKIKSQKHEIEEKVELKDSSLDFLDSILPELAWEYVSYSYGGTGLSKEELITLKNNLLEELKVQKNEISPETVESQLTNKEEVKVKKYTM